MVGSEIPWFPTTFWMQKKHGIKPRLMGYFPQLVIAGFLVAIKVGVARMHTLKT